MADRTVRLNQTIEWVCDGASDTLTVANLSPLLRSGIQCETDFSMVSATVTAILPSGITKVVTVTSGDENVALIGEKFFMSSLEFTNIAAGTYTVRFAQALV